MSKCKLDIMVWAGSGWGKTSQIGNVAEWLYREHGLRTRLVSTSGGGYKCIAAHVKAGIVEPIMLRNIDQFPYPIEALRRISWGWWLNADGILVPPASWKTRAGYQNWKHGFQDDWDGFGCFAFDGVAEFCMHLMEHLRAKAAKGEISGDMKGASNYSDGTDKFSGKSWPMYGDIQSYAYAAIQAAQTAYTNKYVIWTTLEDKGEDDISKSPVYGPKMIGKAITDDSKAFCENCFHGSQDSQDLQVGKEIKSVITRKLWFKPHHDRMGNPFISKIAVDGHFSDDVPDCLEGAELQLAEGKKTGLVKAIEIIEAAEQKAMSRFAKEKV